MAISVGIPVSDEIGGNPGTIAYDNVAGVYVIGFVSGRNSAGNTPLPTSGGAVYNSVAMTVRQLADRGWAASAIWELASPSLGSNTYDPDGSNCTYSTWGIVELVGAKASDAYKDGGNKTGLGTSATLDAAVETSPGGIIVGIVSRGHATTLGIPAGWTQIYYETEAGGGGAIAAYKLTDGTSINPVFTLASSYEWSLSVASYRPIVGALPATSFPVTKDLIGSRIPNIEVSKLRTEV